MIECRCSLKKMQAGEIRLGRLAISLDGPVCDMEAVRTVSW